MEENQVIKIINEVAQKRLVCYFSSKIIGAGTSECKLSGERGSGMEINREKLLSVILWEIIIVT